jgi:hypothetical protein
MYLSNHPLLISSKEPTVSFPVVDGSPTSEPAQPVHNEEQRAVSASSNGSNTSSLPDAKAILEHVGNFSNYPLYKLPVTPDITKMYEHATKEIKKDIVQVRA